MLVHVVLSLLVLIADRFVIYPAYTSPVAKIPNAHTLSSLTSLWILWKRFRGREIQTVDEAFKKNGPVVRLGPNELSVNMIDGGIRSIQGGGFEKTEWYDFFMNHGSDAFFLVIIRCPFF